jgi:hypothetical protein
LLELFGMKSNSTTVISRRVVVILFLAMLALSLFNTYLILIRTSGPVDTSAISYDFVITQVNNNYQMKNMLTGYTTSTSESASTAINDALVHGKAIYLNPGLYILDQDVLVSNKMNAKIVSDGAIILGNGHRIIITGDNYTTSKYAAISGLTLINTTIRVENSFATTISNIVFENTSKAIEIANTNSWSEYTEITDCHIINATEGIAFRTPASNATGSYASSQINRCFFNLKDNSIGINVEPSAELSDSQIQDVRFWLGEDGRSNQTGLKVDGSMYQTLLFGVVFESFTDNPNNMYALDVGRTANPAPIIDAGVSFLGNWTSRIHNPYSVWIPGVGSAFERENVRVPVGLNNSFGDNITIQTLPLKIFNFKPKIEVGGSLGNSEVVTVRIRFEYADNAISDSVIKTFTSTGAVWLTDDEMMQLYPSQSVIWAILVDAKSSTSLTNTIVTFSGYGTAG